MRHKKLICRYHTDYCVPADKQSRLMPMFGVKDIKDLTPLNPPRTQDLTPVDIEDMYPSTNENIVCGGHGLFSTLDDYAKFARMLLTGQGPGGELILSRKMLEISKANRIPASQLPLKIGINPLLGYGWGLTGRVMIDVFMSQYLGSMQPLSDDMRSAPYQMIA